MNISVFHYADKFLCSRTVRKNRNHNRSVVAGWKGSLNNAIFDTSTRQCHSAGFVIGGNNYQCFFVISGKFKRLANAKMEKCDLCLERIEQGQQPICVEACPMYALDFGYIDDLKSNYGEVTEAEGFRYSDRFKPAVIFRKKNG